MYSVHFIAHNTYSLERLITHNKQLTELSNTIISSHVEDE